MCKPTTAKVSSAKEKVEEEEVKTAKGTTLLPAPTLTLSQFFDLKQPWVLVPNGSFMGYFDNVPIMFRVGPWNIACCVYLFALIYWILLECIQCYNDPPKVSASDYGYFGTDTWQWWYNAAGFLWTSYIASKVTQSPMGKASWVSYTLQHWTLIIIRHGLSTLAPFFPTVLAPLNEYLRFAMLLQATVVFVLWNFALMPAITMTLKAGKTRWDFLKFCFGFLLSNLHIANLPLAVMNGVYGSPMRTLNKIDFCVALGLALQYVLFYLLVLDRIGFHLYFIFSPRSPLALLTWTAFIGIHYGGFALWKSGIEQYGIEK